MAPYDTGVVPQGIAVLHVALEPTSGVWSVMRDVTAAQAASGRYRAVAMGVIASTDWPTRYADEFRQLELPTYQSTTLKAFGTAKFLWQRVQPPPIGAWVEDLRRKSGAERVVVHIHNAWLSGVFLPIKRADPKTTDVVVTFHGVCTTLAGEPLRRRLHSWMSQRLLRFNAKLTSADAGNLPLAESIFGVPPERFSIIANGVKADPTLSAAAWLGTGEFVVGYVGLLAEHKGWSIIADAVLKVRAGGRNVRLLIAGAGGQEAMVRSRAEADPQAIEFVGHVTAPRESIMPRLHALSLMSTYEGLPMVLIEAASIGLPVVATATGGVREILDHGVTGIVVERSADELAEALESLYDSPATMARMGEAARAAHARSFEIGRIAEQYHAVYAR